MTPCLGSLLPHQQNRDNSFTDTGRSYREREKDAHANIFPDDFTVSQTPAWNLRHYYLFLGEFQSFHFLCPRPCVIFHNTKLDLNSLFVCMCGERTINNTVSQMQDRDSVRLHYYKNATALGSDQSVGSRGSLACRVYRAHRGGAVGVFRDKLLRGLVFFRCRWFPGCARLMTISLLPLPLSLSPSLRLGFMQLLHQKAHDSRTPTQPSGRHHSKKTDNNVKMCCSITGL